MSLVSYRGFIKDPPWTVINAARWEASGLNIYRTITNWRVSASSNAGDIALNNGMYVPETGFVIDVYASIYRATVTSVAQWKMRITLDGVQVIEEFTGSSTQRTLSVTAQNILTREGQVLGVDVYSSNTSATAIEAGDVFIQASRVSYP